MLLAGPITTPPLPLWLEPGPELVDVLAGDGMGDGVSATLKTREAMREAGAVKMGKLIRCGLFLDTITMVSLCSMLR